jgi:uncharacterized protein
MNTLTTLALTAAATLAGFVDAIAGGGGLITLPALLLAGVPPAQALATNKLQGTFGVAIASVNFHRAGMIDLKRLRSAVLATASGAALGATAVGWLDASALKCIMPFALIAAALYFAFATAVREHVARRSLAPLAFALGVAAPVGFYDGFFGPGAGSLFTLGLVALAGNTMMQATANAKVLNLTSNVLSLTVFALSGTVNYAVGLPMALGQMAGAWAGSHIAIKHGTWIIRPLLVATTSAVALKLLLAR